MLNDHTINFINIVAVFLSAAMQATQHIIDNFLRHIFCTLKEKDRYVEEGWSRTNYEATFDTINEAFSPSQPLYRPTNSEVESFYRGTATAEEFVRKVDERIISKVRSKLDGDLDPLLSISWDIYSSVPVRNETCSSIQKLSARRLWAVFNKLDTGRESLVDIDDITDLIMKLYTNVGQEGETKENIQEWFCNQPSVDYWSFYSALVENHRDLLQPMSVQNLHKVRRFTLQQYALGTSRAAVKRQLCLCSMTSFSCV